MIDWEKRRKSEAWAREKAFEFCVANSDLTFAEWCYQLGKAVERRKFAEWLKDNDYLNSIEFTEDDRVIIDSLFADDVIEEYVKERT